MRQFASQVSAKSFDGLLVIEPEGTLDYIAELHARGPAGGAHRRPRRTSRSSRRSRPPTAAAARAAARHLLELGRRRPLVITGAGAVRLHPGPARRLRRRATPRPASRSTRDWWSRATSPSTAGARRSSRPLAAGVEFDAVFAHNDLSAAGAMQALRDAGRRVPEDVAVVGFDDIPLRRAHRAAADHRAPADARRWARRRPGCCIAHFDGTPLPSTPDRHAHHAHRPRLDPRRDPSAGHRVAPRDTHRTHRTNGRRRLPRRAHRRPASDHSPLHRDRRHEGATHATPDAPSRSPSPGVLAAAGLAACGDSAERQGKAHERQPRPCSTSACRTARRPRTTTRSSAPRPPPRSATAG